MSLCEDKRIFLWVLNAESIIVNSHAFGQNLFSLDCTRMHEFVGGHVLSLAVGTYPKGERCCSGKHSAPWIHVSGFHQRLTGR
jgi:hypothetical protein